MDVYTLDTEEFSTGLTQACRALLYYLYKKGDLSEERYTYLSHRVQISIKKPSKISKMWKKLFKVEDDLDIYIVSELFIDHLYKEAIRE